jgi:hypothetical protein
LKNNESILKDFRSGDEAVVALNKTVPGLADRARARNRCVAVPLDRS